MKKSLTFFCVLNPFAWDKKLRTDQTKERQKLKSRHFVFLTIIEDCLPDMEKKKFIKSQVQIS